MYDGFGSHDGFDSHNGHDDHNKFTAPGQARKAVQTYNLQRACLEDLHGCRQLSGWNTLVQKNLQRWP